MESRHIRADSAHGWYAARNADMIITGLAEWLTTIRAQYLVTRVIHDSGSFLFLVRFRFRLVIRSGRLNPRDFTRFRGNSHDSLFFPVLIAKKFALPALKGSLVRVSL
jgi:hypothetical protein